MAEFLRYELKEFDTATLSGTFQNFGSALSNAAKSAEFTNTSTVDAYISVEGTNNALRVAAGKVVSVPSYPKHNDLNEGSFVLKKGVQLKVKQVTAGAAGALIGHIYT
jgi:hypothetical protein